MTVAAASCLALSGNSIAADAKAAEARLNEKMLKGGGGVWGSTPMPAVGAQVKKRRPWNYCGLGFIAIKKPGLAQLRQSGPFDI